MPQMDGYELASAIKSHPRMRHTPQFIDRQSNQSAHIIKGYESGAVDFLTKPINPYILRAKVDVFLKLEQYRCDIVQARLAHEQLVIEKAIWERLQLQMMQFKKWKVWGA
jgi:PleD family two-component response regulator